MAEGDEMSVKAALVDIAREEWDRFGRSTRTLDDKWDIIGDEAQQPYTGYISKYWASVDRPTWDGNTKAPWSAAFICWCFETALDRAGSKRRFDPSAGHSKYINRIRLHQGMTSSLVLVSAKDSPVTTGDLIWNSRGKNKPESFEEAITRLDIAPKPDYFDSHVDIVVDVGPGSCHSIGGNVSNKEVGGSVTRSEWKMDQGGFLTDPRKTWLGIVKIYF